MANDWDAEASNLIKTNLEFNKVTSDSEVTSMDATDLMYERKAKNDKYDVIDLDPYGTACPFLDAAI